jgi:glycerate 2-kinase
LETRALLRHLLDAAIASGDAHACLPPFLPVPPRGGRTVVVGAGKAGGAMAAALERAWPGEASGLVVTQYGYGRPTTAIDVVEAAHPTPDLAGVAAARRILQLASALGRQDLLIALISGGGSALLTLPAAGVNLEDKQDLTRQLLRAGAAVTEINCVRKHLSAIKGGRLAVAAWPARVVSLAISDVVGDDPSMIASGPTLADPTTQADARAVIDRYGLRCPAAVLEHLSDPRNETPKPGDARLQGADYRLIATPRAALDAAAEGAARHGYEVIDLGERIQGEARLVAQAHARLAIDAKREGRRVCILSGGETTVTVRGAGRGGRNSEYLLALALALDGAPGVHALAADTDGRDGTDNNAGAVIDPTSLSRARALGLDPGAALEDNDAYSVFERLGDLVATGPTFTNLNDLRAILVDPR